MSNSHWKINDDDDDYDDDDDDDERGAIDPCHKSHNASDKYPKMYFVTCAHFCCKIVGNGTGALWD